MIAQQLEQTLQTTMKECTNEAEEDTIFVDFMDAENYETPIYQEVDYAKREALKSTCERYLQVYNEKARSKAMNIVLF